MNAYDIVEQILDKKVTILTDNELSLIAGEEKPIVEAILKVKYNGHYKPSQLSGFCSAYHFNNPKAKKESGFLLKYITICDLKQEGEAIIKGENIEKVWGDNFRNNS